MANYVFAWNGGKPVQDELHTYNELRAKVAKEWSELMKSTFSFILLR